jgi:hypothetical protein
MEKNTNIIRHVNGSNAAARTEGIGWMFGGGINTHMLRSMAMMPNVGSRSPFGQDRYRRREYEKYF